MSIVARPIFNGLLAVTTVLLAACASGPQIDHDTNPAANFSAYQSCGVF